MFYRVSAKAAPSVERSHPGSIAIFPSSSASPRESVAPSCSASSAAAGVPTAVAQNLRNTLLLIRRCLTRAAAGAIEVGPRVLRLWANIIMALLLPQAHHHLKDRLGRGRRIRMRQTGTSQCRHQYIEVVCGMHRSFFSFLELVYEKQYHGRLHPS